MPLIYVTGLSGTGKSAICEELQLRGFDAHDTDREGNSVWVDRKTGHPTANIEPPRPPGWLEQHGWFVVPTRVEELATRSEGRLTFLCGSTENDRDVWHLFSKVIYLTVDEATLRHRLETRTSNDFGKTPDELAAVLMWHKTGAAQYRSLGASIIDATRPLDEVVDDVIDIAQAAKP